MFDSDKRKAKELSKTVNEILDKYNYYKSFIDKCSSYDEKTKLISDISGHLKYYINTEINEENEDKVLDKYLPFAYAICMCAIELVTGNKLYNCQLEGGILLNEGYISEMATGEGKTRTAILPAFLNALTGRGVNVVTPNEYLAGRDYLETKDIYNMLGVSCGLASEYKSPSREEIIKICAELYHVSVNSVTNQMINSSIEKIHEIYRKQYIERQKAAYKCDVIYSSKDTLAFDYLKDVVCRNEDDMLQSKRANFAIVDEVDAILFEDAQTPFILSGPMRTKTRFRNKEEKEFYDMSRRYLKIVPEQMNRAVMDIAILAGRGFNLNKNNTGLVSISGEIEANDINGIGEAFSKIPTVINNPLPNGCEVPRLVEFDEEKNSVVLTDEGYMMVYKYFNKKKIDDYCRANKNKIIGNLENEIDYNIASDGTLILTEIGLINAINDSNFSDLYDDFNNWCINFLAINSLHLVNALTANFNIMSGKEYQLHTTNRKTIGGREVKQVELIINGRTSEGRTYSEGLQQAIEYKEKELSKLLNRDYDVSVTEYKDTLASIPTISFFKRFNKLAGMTGTSSKDHFKNLYGLRTYSVPRNKERRVIDRGDMFYINSVDKDKAIIREIITSIKKNQPVLLSTTSVGESKRYFNLISNVLKRNGFNNEIMILNAEMKDREKEAKLIARAGMPGAITIATNMAGRGTDIKLGGVIESLDEAINRIKEEVVQKRINKAIDAGMVKDTETYNNLIKFYRAQNEKNINQIKDIAKKQIANNTRDREINKKIVEDAGGLKVVCAGHFKSIREDRQVMGRCGRQGEKGETVFISCPNDLIDIGMDYRLVNLIIDRCDDCCLLDDFINSKHYIRKEVEKVQRRNDSFISDNIFYNEKREGYISRFRNYLVDLRYSLRENNDYSSYIIEVIKDTIREFVSNASKYRLTKDEIIYYFDNMFGIKVNLDEELDSELLITYLTELALRKFEEVKKERDSKVNEEVYKLLAFNMIDGVWDDFEELVDGFKNQEFANQLASYQGEEFKVLATNGFFDCLKLNKAELVKLIFNSHVDNKVMNIFPIYTRDKEKIENEVLRRKREDEESYIY